MKTKLVRKNDSLMLKVEAPPSKVFGNVRFALIYFNGGYFDIEYYRENNSGKALCEDVKYWVSDLKKAVKYASNSLKYAQEY